MPTLNEIASCVGGYDPDALAVEAARDFIARLVQPVTTVETLAIRSALGRVLASDIVSPIDVPAADNSAMDGYALRGADLASTGPSTLRSVGTGFAGQHFTGVPQAGECVRIMTGAVMPTGSTPSSRRNFAQVDGGRVTVPAGAVRPGDNRRCAGEDLARGDSPLCAGRLLRPADIGLLASLGHGRSAGVPSRSRRLLLDRRRAALARTAARTRRGLRQQPLHGLGDAQSPRRRAARPRRGARRSGRARAGVHPWQRRAPTP